MEFPTCKKSVARGRPAFELLFEKCGADYQGNIEISAARFDQLQLFQNLAKPEHAGALAELLVALQKKDESAAMKAKSTAPAASGSAGGLKGSSSGSKASSSGSKPSAEDAGNAAAMLMFA